MPKERQTTSKLQLSAVGYYVPLWGDVIFSCNRQTLFLKYPDRSSENEHMLELDAINTNPCMKMILQVISELHGSITPPPKEMAREEGSMPSWMRDMYKKMVDQSKLLHPGCSY